MLVQGAGSTTGRGRGEKGPGAAGSCCTQQTALRLLHGMHGRGCVMGLAADAGCKSCDLDRDRNSEQDRMDGYRRIVAVVLCVGGRWRSSSSLS